MARITNGPILDGDPVNAAGLNSRFTAFSQAGNLDQFNTRDAAIDLPQFETARFLAPRLEVGSIGANDWKHATYRTAAGQVTGDAPHVVKDSGGTDTPLALGAGWALAVGELLRVYWDLSVRPVWASSRPWAGGSEFEWTFTAGSSTINCSNNTGCWAFWLQWDTTDATLTNWTNVPTQESFNNIAVGTRGGALLGNLQATSIVPATNETATNANNGQFAGYSTVEIGWTSVDGAWHYAPAAPITIYGLRVVFTGPLCAYHAASNWLVREDSIAADAELYYNGGSMQALVMRLA
jgi:hypothetical protein